MNGKRIDGSELLDNVINRGLGRMSMVARQEAPGESTAFFVKIEVVLFETIYPYAERAGIGYRQGRTFYFTRDFVGELSKSKTSMCRAADAYGYEKVLFLACYDAVVARCKRVIPEDARHADLIALCMFKAYDAIIMNSFIERFGTG